MTDRELMQMALDALIETVRLAGEYGTHLIRNDKDAGHAYETIEALRARLAQPEPEPVAWMDSDGFAWTKQGVECRTTPDTYTPLYYAPPQREWQGLTDEEIMDACSAVWASHPVEVGQVVAAKLKEKNT